MMREFLIPVDLIFVPARYAKSFSDAPCLNDGYVPIVACNMNNAPLPFWKRLRAPDAATPRVDMYDRDRLIVEDDFEVVATAKASGKPWLFAKAEDEIIGKWEARDSSRLKEITANTDRTAFYNPVYLEDFRKVKTSRPDPVRLDRFRRLLGQMSPGLTGLDIGCNIGYWTHHMARQGMAMTALDLDRQHLDVAECLTDIYGLSARFINTEFDRFEAGLGYDLVIALTVLYHIFFRQDKMSAEDAARKVGALTKSVLFWESGDQPAREKELLLGHAGFDTYRTLGPTSGTGLDRELGFFCKCDSSLSKRLLDRYDAVGAQWIIEGR